MKNIFLVFLLFSFPLLLFAKSDRVALLIGNSDYEHGGILVNPKNDVADLAEKLKKSGFEVSLYRDLGLVDMKRAIDDFGQSLDQAKVGLFFFAGHGLQAKGRNYLVPVDADLHTENDVEYNCVEGGRILGKMEDAGTRTNIVILDACRQNPFERSWNRNSRGNGLAFMSAPEGSIIAYSTGPGNTAADGSFRNSPYTSALLRYMDVPNLKIEDFFKLVRVRVKEHTMGEQIPWEHTSLEGDFYFTEKGDPEKNQAEIASVEPELFQKDPGIATQREDPAGSYEDARKILASGIRSIAILPFANYTGDDSKIYLAEGLQDALITELGTFGSLKVTSKTSTLSYADFNKSLAEIAAELKVTGLVETSLIVVGNMVRIQLKLYSVNPDEQLIWTQVFDSDMSDIFGLFNRVIKQIAGEIQLTLSPEQENRLSFAEKVDPEAYDAYVIGRHYWNSFTPDELDKALGYFRMAQQKDPDFALAHLGISDALYGKLVLGFAENPQITLRDIMASLQKALELDPALPEIHYSLANVNSNVFWDWEKAEEQYSKAIQLNPNFADAYAAYSNHLLMLGRSKESLINAEKALELDPQGIFTKFHFGATRYFAGEYSSAMRTFRQMLSIEPNNFLANNMLPYTYHMMGMYGEELRQLKSFLSTFYPHENIKYDQIFGNMDVERHSDILNEIAGQLSANTTGVKLDNVNIAMIYACAGNKGKALDLLELSLEERNPNLPYLLNPVFLILKEEPRFRQICEQMNIPVQGYVFGI